MTCCAEATSVKALGDAAGIERKQVEAQIILVFPGVNFFMDASYQQLGQRGQNLRRPMGEQNGNHSSGHCSWEP